MDFTQLASNPNNVVAILVSYGSKHLSFDPPPPPPLTAPAAQAPDPAQVAYLIKPLVASNGLPCLYSCGHHLGCRVVTPWGRQSVRAHNSTLESAV